MAGTKGLAAWSSQALTGDPRDVLAHFLLTFESKHTRRNYGRDFLAFLDFCAECDLPVTHVADIDRERIALWSDALTPCAVASRARRMASLASVLSFAQEKNLIERHPFDGMKRPRVRPAARTNAFTVEEMEALLAHCAQDALAKRETGGRSYASARLRYVVIGTLLTVGMRVDELCELRIGDLDVTGPQARLHMTAKGGREHAPLIPEETARLLTDYVAEFRRDAARSAPLFVRAQAVRKPTRLSQQGVYLLIREAAREIGISKAVSPHSCRATLATLLHNGGVPLGHIQRLLNHRQITTTALYLRQANELEEAASLKLDL